MYAPTARIIAGVRDPTTSQAQELQSYGRNVLLIRASLGEPESLPGIVANADALFINVPGAADRTMLTINAIDAAKRGQVRNTMLIRSYMSCSPTIIR